MNDEKVKQVMIKVQLQTLRLKLIVALNQAYPAKLDLATLQALLEHVGQRRIIRELSYLSEIGFLHSRRSKRWRITALGRDFLLGLVDAKGVGEPVGYGDIGEG
jgi:hypothetical protein